MVGDDRDMGDLVLLVRTRQDGRVERDWMPASIAIIECGYHSDNGVVYRSARIIADDVDMGLWDRSG